MNNLNATDDRNTPYNVYSCSASNLLFHTLIIQKLIFPRENLRSFPEN